MIARKNLPQCWEIFLSDGESIPAVSTSPRYLSPRLLPVRTRGADLNYLWDYFNDSSACRDSSHAYFYDSTASFNSSCPHFNDSTAQKNSSQAHWKDSIPGGNDSRRGLNLMR